MSLTDKNLFAYCDNNPVIREDNGGMFWDTVFDVVSLCISVVDVIKNPDDLSAWAGLAGDALDLIPFVTGVGEVTKAFTKGKKVINAFDNMHDVGKGMEKLGDTVETIDGTIDTYKALKKSNESIGKEVHHIVEKRFAKSLNISNTNDMLSIALDKDTHRMFTNAWRKEFKYGTKYSLLGKNDIWNAAQRIYANYPELMEAARKTIFN